MAWRLPDGLLGDMSSWQNRNDQTMFDRAFQTGDLEEQKMAMALTCANPDTPEDFIRDTLVNTEMTPRTGFSAPPLTMEDVFARSTGLPGDNNVAMQNGAH